MTISRFIDIAKESGLKISVFKDYFFLRSEFVSYSFPLCHKIDVTKELVRAHRLKNLFTVLLTNYVQKNTFEFILETSIYTLEKFPRKTRNRIRKSLQNCSFRKPELNELIDSGLRINKQTLLRQNRDNKFLSNRKKWEKYLSIIYKCEDIEIMAAYFHEKIVGNIILAKIDDKFCIQHAFIDKEDSELTAPMNGLLFTIINKLINENGLIKISYGLDSIKDLPELNRFKLNMLFQREYMTRVFVYNPLILPFIKLSVFFTLSILKRRSIKNKFLRTVIHIYYGHRLFERVLVKE